MNHTVRFLPQEVTYFAHEVITLSSESVNFTTCRDETRVIKFYPANLLLKINPCFFNQGSCAREYTSFLKPLLKQGTQIEDIDFYW